MNDLWLCTASHDSGDELRRMWKAARRRRIFRATTVASLLLLGAALAYWAAPIFLGGAR